MGDFAAPGAASSGLCLVGGGGGAPQLGSHGGGPAPPPPAAHGAVPKHSAVVERLRQRIEGCRRHHGHCEGRYQHGQAEQLEQERRDTVSLYQRSLEQRGGGKKGPPGGAAGGHKQQVGKEQHCEAAEQRNHTLIMLQETVKRKLEGARSPVNGEQQNGICDFDFSPTNKRMRKDIPGVDPITNLPNNMPLPSVSPLPQLDIKPSLPLQNSVTHSSGLDDLGKNGGLTDIKVPANGCSDLDDGFNILQSKDLKQEPLDDPVGIDTSETSLSNQNKLFSDINLNDQEWQELIDELANTVPEDDIQDLFNEDFEDKKELEFPRPTSHTPIPQEILSVKSDPAHSPFAHIPMGSPQVRPSSSGPLFSNVNSSSSMPSASSATPATFSASSPANCAVHSPQTPNQAHTPGQSQTRPGSGYVLNPAGAVAGGGSGPAPVTVTSGDLSPAEQLKQMAAQQQQRAKLMQQKQQQQHAGPAASWSPVGPTSPYGGPYSTEKPNSPLMYPQAFNNQNSIVPQMTTNQSKTAMNNYLPSNHMNMISQQPNNLGTSTVHKQSNMLTYANTKPLTHYNVDISQRVTPPMANPNKNPMIPYMQQQQQQQAPQIQAQIAHLSEEQKRMLIMKQKGLMSQSMAYAALSSHGQTRSTRHSQGSQPGLADQAAKLSFASAESLETMSEADLPLGFNRMNRFRQSLPLSRSTSQTKLRSPGVLFLQFGDESRRVHITHEISSMDTLHALIVHMFPQKLTMGMLKSPNTAILIKDESRNVFYELEDVRDIQDRSIIKIFRKEPLYASFPGAHMTNGDLRRDMVYSARDSSPTRRLNNMSPASHLSSGSPPPVLQSSSPARSRMSYSGGRPPSFAGSPVHHSERHSNLPPAQGVSPSPSAILERRDVKPDEDLANKNVVLVKNEGLYADPYGMVHEGRLSISSTQSLAGMGDPFSYPGGLYKRGSVRSLSTYSAAALQSELEDSLYKPNTQMYSDPYGPGMGFRLPPSSPQKMTDGRLVDVQQGQSPHSTYSGPSSRSSPVRQTFRKDSSSSVFMDSPVNKTRNSSSSGPPEIFPGPGERPLSGFSSPVPPKEVETRERMEAMEKQIASLTGLVQSALFRGSEGDNPSEKTDPTNGAAPSTGSVIQSKRNSMATSDSTPMQTTTGPVNQQAAITRLHMQLHLHGLQQNTSELRNQLQQLKKMQLQNQETVKTMLKRTETEISVRVTDTMRKQEDPLQRQRALVEEERLKYLNEEELVTQQLSDLEKSVEKIKKDLSHSHQLISVQELEEKALVLQQLGETLTELKAHFPSLQSKMRVILRVEVEAVKFLKEEPQRLDTLLKRCKSVTDTLAQIRRQVEQGVWTPTDNLHNQSPKQVMAESEFTKTADFDFPTSPPMNFHELTSSQNPSWESLSHGVSGYNQSSSGSQTNVQRSHNPSRAGEMVAVKTQTGPEVPIKRMSADKSVSVEAAERDWEEKRAALTQYSAKDINRLLEETQAELMKAIPDLEFAAKHKQSGSTTSTPEHKPTKPQHTSKGTTKIDPNGRRGSEELTVPRYRTEKPSKSPPPPPPRRSFPSSHGITTARTGEVIVTSKKETTYIKKADSEELESQKPQVKLRRTVSEVARPASTPPIIASGIKDDDDEDRIIAELESGGVSIPAMKMVNPAASRLKVTQQQGSPDKSKHIKQRMEYMRIQGQQQAAKPSKEASGVNDTSNPGSEKSSPARTSIPVLTSFGTRNSSISF